MLWCLNNENGYLNNGTKRALNVIIRTVIHIYTNTHKQTHTHTHIYLFFINVDENLNLSMPLIALHA